MTVVTLRDKGACADLIVIGVVAPTITTIKISLPESTLSHVCHAESPAQEAIARR
jgi:hypothetical protein